MSLVHLLDGLRASYLGRRFYDLKCAVRRLKAPLQQKADEAYLKSLPGKVDALRKKECITVLFFAIHPAYWRTDTLYRAMLKHPRFRPVIVACGSVEHGHAAQLKDQERIETFLQEKGYTYLKGYDPSRKNPLLDIRAEVNPDLLFYAKPYTGLLPKAYEYDKFMDKLFIYLPYAIQTTNCPELCNTRYCQLSWMQFYESSKVFEESPILERNSRVVGSALVDLFNERKALLQPVGEGDENERRKCIIWAPHHSIESQGSLCYSNFLNIAADFVKLTEQYADRIDFVFKPHPLLYQALCNHRDWGKERADAYYRQWQTGNRRVEDGEYMDLFLRSDALIHDCGSFTAEYLITGNPVLYLAKDHHDATLNGLGKAAFAVHYQGADIESVRRFIEDAVLQGVDPKRAERHEFFTRYLASPNPNYTATENIINEILKFNV